VEQEGRMLRFALLRTLGAIPTLLLVIAVAFIMVRAAPGGPFDDERVLPPDSARNLAAAYHLDESLPRQFWRYLSGLARGDLGPSYHYRDYTVAELIGNALPVSLTLGALALLLALLVGGCMGVAAALRRNTVFDRLVTGLAMTGISIPVFVVAPLIVLVFAVWLQWLPASWSGGTGLPRLVLPVIALALPQVAYITRLVRGSLIEVLGSDYIRTARAQGLATTSILRHHALKPALIPLVSYLGPAFAAVLTGAVVIEAIFGIPGLGQLFLQSGLNRDYTLVLGIVIFYAVLIILLNLAADLLYGVLDPRIRER
jgi:oligopeptide transport system permease protein